MSIWPQSGEADLSQLQLSLLTDTGGSNDSNDSNGSNGYNDTSTWPCPRGHGDLRWCRDTCYSGHVCDQDSQEEDTQIGHVYGVESNILSTIFEDHVALQVSTLNTLKIVDYLDISLKYFLFLIFYTALLQAALEVRMLGPQTAYVGEELPVEIVIENTAEGPAREVEVAVASSKEYSIGSQTANHKMSIRGKERRWVIKCQL